VTFEDGLFSVLSVGRGQSACWWRTVRDVRVRHVFFVFLLSFAFDLLCFELLLGKVLDGSRVPGGQSAGAWRTVRVLPADGLFFGVRFWRFCWL
jgi:hypothetical protein